MTMSNFDLNHLADTPGVTYKKFCSFCTDEATGDLEVPINEDENFPVPVCESCAKRVLDNGLESMVD